MHTSTPYGYHCKRFDTQLLEQIVAIEVDCAVRRIAREDGVMIDERTQRQWTSRVLEYVEDETFQQLHAHAFLPAALETSMACAISRIVQEEVVGTQKSLPVPQLLPFGRLCWYRPLVSMVRFLFEKRVE